MTPIQATALEINKRLTQVFPEVIPPLNFTNAHELLFAVILSVQSTDVRVNLVTPQLFQRYKMIKDYADADLAELTNIIKSVGLYNNKARNIKRSAQIIMEKFNGQVPSTMEELLTLPGVARKVANVVLAQWFHKFDGIAIDTHIIRVANRLGLTKYTDPKKIEQDLMSLFPQTEWGDVSLRLIFHGRKTCQARKPKCAECVLNDICPSAFKV